MEFIITFLWFHCIKSVQIRSFFWSAFSCIRTEYGDLRSKSPYAARIKGNTYQKKICIWTHFTQCTIVSVWPVRDWWLFILFRGLVYDNTNVSQVIVNRCPKKNFTEHPCICCYRYSDLDNPARKNRFNVNRKSIRKAD